MQCEQIEERFEDHYQSSLCEVEEHLASCPRCQQEWNGFADLMERLATLKAGPAPEFDQRVLNRLEARGLFAEQPSFLENSLQWLQQWLPRVALAACLLLVLWMAGLAGTRPPEELRALQPDQAKRWTHLPDAVPPPPFPGPPPSQQRVQVVVKP